MRYVRDNGLSLFFGALFLAGVAGQSVAGNRAFNQDQLAHGGAAMSYWRFLGSSEFGQALLENWQSEWLQFVLFTLATVWLVQKGSNESKEPGEEGLESEQKQRIGGYAPENAPAVGQDARLANPPLLELAGAPDGGSLLRGRGSASR